MPGGWDECKRLVAQLCISCLSTIETCTRLGIFSVCMAFFVRLFLIREPANNTQQACLAPVLAPESMGKPCGHSESNYQNMRSAVIVFGGCLYRRHHMRVSIRLIRDHSGPPFHGANTVSPRSRERPVE